MYIFYLYYIIQWLTPVPPPCLIVWGDGCDIAWVKFGVLAFLLDDFCGDLTFVTTFVTSFGSLRVLRPLFGSVLVSKVDLFDDFLATFGVLGLPFCLHFGALASLLDPSGPQRRRRRKKQRFGTKNLPILESNMEPKWSQSVQKMKPKSI